MIVTICVVLQVTVCKDGDGKVGMRVKAINKGVFVCLVTKNSPAALAGKVILTVLILSPSFFFHK